MWEFKILPSITKLPSKIEPNLYSQQCVRAAVSCSFAIRNEYQGPIFLPVLFKKKNGILFYFYFYDYEWSWEYASRIY